MRTIKFRAICAFSGVWRYGFYYVSKGNHIIRDENDKESIVLEKTLGQFTGLHDKNGKEIYEGDIVTDGVGRYKIIYDLKLAGYQPYCIFRDEPENYCEVIGNIFDDPELVKL